MTFDLSLWNNSIDVAWRWDVGDQWWGGCFPLWRGTTALQCLYTREKKSISNWSWRLTCVSCVWMWRWSFTGSRSVCVVSEALFQWSLHPCSHLESSHVSICCVLHMASRLVVVSKNSHSKNYMVQCYNMIITQYSHKTPNKATTFFLGFNYL